MSDGGDSAHIGALFCTATVESTPTHTYMNADIALHIAWRADLGAINALARSCKLVADVISARKLDLADRLASRCVNDGIVTYHLPNGLLHGLAYCEGEAEKLVMRYELGRAMSWKLQCSTGTTYGHRMTHHLLRVNDTHDRHTCDIEVGDASNDFDANIDVNSGNVDVVRWGDDERGVRGVNNHQRYDHPPPWRLTSYLVDDELAPSVVNAWVDAVLAASGCGIKVSYDPTRPPTYMWYRGGMSRIANAGDLVHCVG